MSKQRKRNDPVWVALGYEPTNMCLYVIGWDRTAAAVLQKAEERRGSDDPEEYHDATYVKAFLLLGRNPNDPNDWIGPELYEWLRKCGAMPALANKLMRDLGHVVGQVAEEARNESR